MVSSIRKANCSENPFCEARTKRLKRKAGPIVERTKNSVAPKKI